MSWCGDHGGHSKFLFRVILMIFNVQIREYLFDLFIVVWLGWEGLAICLLPLESLNVIFIRLSSREETGK
jgi:hypothetical protein